MIVYVVTNKINGKQYVGQTIQSIRRRWDFHICKRSNCIALKSAIEKYGKENFTIEEQFKASSLEELSKKEQELIFELNTLAPNGYNLTTGGERPEFSEETIKKMSNAKLGMIPWNKGLTKDDPRIDKSTSFARKALKEKFGYSGPNKGKKWSEEAKLNMSKIKSGRIVSEETKRKMSNGHDKTPLFCNENGKTYPSLMDASKDLNINPGQISNMLSGRRKHAKGFTFKKHKDCK